MLRPVDILVVVGLLRERDVNWTVRALAGDLHLPSASVQRSLERLSGTPAYANGSLSVSACQELLIHGLPFIVPGTLGGETRGVPTAWAAPPLSHALAEVGSPPVWPDASGDVRGVALTPLHPSAPTLARADPEMHALLALVDALRVGDARVRALADDQLRGRLFGVDTGPAR